MPNILQPSLSNTASEKTVTSSGATPYATNLLQRGQAFTTAETPVYEGQLTTGPSQYQNQAWQGLANLTVPQNITAAGNQLGNISQQQQNLSYDPTKFTAGTFGAAEAQKYMNPYIQTALDPQMEYQRRQAAINQQADMAKLAQAGAFGGSRQAILQGQNQEALGRQQAATAGAGYERAFAQAQAQYNADQQREMEAQKASEQSKQYGAGYRQTGLSNAANTEQARAQAGASEAQYGLANLNALSAAGTTQQAQEQEALDAQYKDWLRQTEYPGKQLETMKGLIGAMAPYTQKEEVKYGTKEKTAATAAGALKLGKDILGGLGIKSFSDLKSAAQKAGQSIKDYAKTIGVKEDELPKELKEGEEVEPDEKAETGLEEPPLDTGGGNYTPNDPDFYVPTVDDESTIGYGADQYSGAAKGGLIDLLHKMRSYK
jgi:hypothetical protein